MHRVVQKVGIFTGLITLACLGAASPPRAHAPPADAGHVRPGITVLLEDSAALIDGKRVGLMTNQTGIDEHGVSDIDLLWRRAQERGSAGPKLVALFSPEHGIRGTEDRTNLASGRDGRTGVPIYSLYGATVLPPPDIALDGLDVLVIDLQDLGARPWTYVASMVYAMRSAAAHHLPVLVLDRPNPITGDHVEGPVLDSSIAYAGSHSSARAATPTAIYSIPMRHGLTMGELARFYDDALSLGTELHVIPMTGWRRAMWFDETDLPWVKPSPNMPDLASATLYPGVVWLEATNVSVGRGTPDAFQHVGAPWLDARRVVSLLEDRGLAGVRFETERFTPVHPTDRKYGGVPVNGVRIIVTDRERLQTSRLGAALLWAIARTNRDSLRFQRRGFDQLFGVPGGREAIVRGDDPDALIDDALPATVDFEQRSRKYRLYR